MQQFVFVWQSQSGKAQGIAGSLAIASQPSQYFTAYSLGHTVVKAFRGDP